jgi:hypothetical protein
VGLQPFPEASVAITRKTPTEEEAMNKTALVLATVGALGVSAVAAPTPAEARWRGGGFGPALAGGLIAGAVVGGLASSAYAYGPGYGYDYGYGYPAYGGYGYSGYYSGGYAPAYYGGYDSYGYDSYPWGGYRTTYYTTGYAPAYSGYRYRRVVRPAYAYYRGPVVRHYRQRLHRHW